MQVLEAYCQLRVPAHGEELEFLPDSGLQPIHYLRPVLPGTQERLRRTAVDAAETEAAESLAMWTVAALAGVLSLENILLVLTCACSSGWRVAWRVGGMHAGASCSSW